MRARDLVERVPWNLVPVVALVLALAAGGYAFARWRGPALAGEKLLASAVLARGASEDFTPVDPTTIFGPDDEIHLIVQVRDAPPDTPVRVLWVAADAEGIEPDTLITEYALVMSDDQRGEFTLRNDEPWPPGRYRADLSIGGLPARSIEFEIR